MRRLSRKFEKEILEPLEISWQYEWKMIPEDESEPQRQEYFQYNEEEKRYYRSIQQSYGYYQKKIGEINHPNTFESSGCPINNSFNLCKRCKTKEIKELHTKWKGERL